jgi:hypothetical protein
VRGRENERRCGTVGGGREGKGKREGLWDDGASGCREKVSLTEGIVYSLYTVQC